jgi:energy-coupling factor transport system ATP-binding protein
MPIEVKNLTYIYDQGLPFQYKALDDVSLTIADNTITGIIGSTGSGKSTLIQHFNALLTPTSGTVTVDGQDISQKSTDKKTLRRKVGLVFQYPETQLFGETVFHDVAFGPTKMGLVPEEIKRRVASSLNMVGLDVEQYGTRSPFQLSGGEKRKVAIAGILAIEPKILVLDEPTAGLDPASRTLLLGLVQDFAKSGKTIIMVSHDMDEIAKICQNVIIMKKSKALFVGDTGEAFSNPGIIAQAGLDVPALSYIGDRLRSCGFDLPKKTFDASELASLIAGQVK